MYQYRKHLRASFLNYIIVIPIFLSIVFLGVFGAILSEGTKVVNIDFLFLGELLIKGFIVLLVYMAILYFLFLRRFKYINVSLTEDAIIYNNIKKKIVIPYDEIIEIKYPSIRYTGGWMEIKHTKGKIRLTVVLENIGDFMYKLKEILDERGKSNLYNEKKSLNFFKTASFSDESWERMYSNVKYMIIMEYISVIISVILAFFGFIENPMTIIWGSIFAPISGYFIIEFILGRNVKKRLIGNEFKLLDRDLNNENKKIRIATLVSTLIYVFLIIII